MQTSLLKLVLQKSHMANNYILSVNLTETSHLHIIYIWLTLVPYFYGGFKSYGADTKREKYLTLMSSVILTLNRHGGNIHSAHCLDMDNV